MSGDGGCIDGSGIATAIGVGTLGPAIAGRESGVEVPQKGHRLLVEDHGAPGGRDLRAPRLIQAPGHAPGGRGGASQSGASGDLWGSWGTRARCGDREWAKDPPPSWRARGERDGDGDGPIGSGGRAGRWAGGCFDWSEFHGLQEAQGFMTNARRVQSARKKHTSSLRKIILCSII